MLAIQPESNVVVQVQSQPFSHISYFKLPVLVPQALEHVFIVKLLAMYFKYNKEGDDGCVHSDA